MFFARCLQPGSLIFQMFKQKHARQKLGESLVKVLTHFAESLYMYALHRHYIYVCIAYAKSFAHFEVNILKQNVRKSLAILAKILRTVGEIVGQHLANILGNFGQTLG